VAVEKMERKASDNKYFHKDFHNFMNMGLIYIAEHFGDDSVREYLRQFASSFYAPLTDDLKVRGLKALKEHFEEIYRLEESSDDIEMLLSKDRLVLKVNKCPAVTHMKRSGIAVSPLFFETSKTVYETVCDGTPYEYELDSYDEDSGAAVQHFTRKELKK
jgi:hypothetical protein